VTEPLLNGAQINPRPETSGSKGSSEFVQPEILRVELRTFCHSLQTVEEVEFGVATGGREDQIAGFVCFLLPNLQTIR